MRGCADRPFGARLLTPAACLLAVCSLAPSAFADELPADLTPYRVSASVGFEEGAAFPPAFRERVRADLLRTAARSIGERWSLTLVEAGEAVSTASGIAALDIASVPIARREPAAGAEIGFPGDDAPDKYLFVAVITDGSGYFVSAREWDRVSDTPGPVRTAAAATRDGIAGAALTSMIAAFRPVAAVGSSDEASASLTMRAGGIPAPDPAAANIAPGTLFMVVFRKFDREGVLTEVRQVPFTYLEVSKVERGAATAAIRSALRRPLAGRRGRVEAWAVAVPPAADGTRLQVTRRGDGVPLSGRVVEVRSKPAEPGKEEPPAEATLLTDRSGAVSIAADPKRPLLWLTVRSGDATLMRLPLAPGVEREVTLPLGDDQRRLDAESRISIVTGELIETVAKRATLLAKARTAARTGRYEDADAALADAARLPDAAAFRRRLAAVEAPAADAAEKEGDRMAAARIRALGRKAAGLVDRYLGAEVLRMTREEVEELKRTDPDRVPAKS